MIGIIECPKPALDKLERAGLVDKILKNKEKWWMASRSSGFYTKDFYEVFEEANKALSEIPLDKNNKIRKIYSEIYELSSQVSKNEYLRPGDILIEYPSVLAYMAIGSDVLNFLDHGFETRRQLEESITSFCLGDHPSSEGSYLWVSGNYKNHLTNSYHGDCWILQTDISGKHSLERTLFGEQEVFDTWKDVSECKKGINTSHYSWKTWLIIILKYADVLGKKNIPEIVNWRDVVRETGVAGTCTAEAEFGSSALGRFIDLDDQLIVEGVELSGNCPLAIRSDSDKVYFPYVKNEKLFLLTEDKNGVITPFRGTRLEGKKFSSELIYEPNDLPHLLKSTYKLFARDRRIMPVIIDLFLKEVTNKK